MSLHGATRYMGLAVSGQLETPPPPLSHFPSQVPREWCQRADMLRSLDVQHDTPHAWRQAPDERYAWNHHGSEVAHLKQRLVRR